MTEGRTRGFPGKALAAVDRLMPQWAKEVVPKSLRGRVGSRMAEGARALPSYARLAALMSRYRVDRLVGTDPATFEARIREFLDMDDAAMEGFRDPERQRAFSVRFRWGHDHDFGSFALPGMMGDRHLTMLATFRDRLGALPFSLEGKRMLDIGCWTGGASLVLAAMGAEVVAVDEVRKYIEALGYLQQAFGIEGLHPQTRSLYECRGEGFDDAFDIVLFAGVLYHVTDPVLALRIVFDCLKNGGTCLVETAAVRSRRSVMKYEGPSEDVAAARAGDVASGWNWFLPSALALARMMRDVGFADVRAEAAPGSRVYAVGRRAGHVDMLRAGLSARDVR